MKFSRKRICLLIYRVAERSKEVARASVRKQLSLHRKRARVRVPRPSYPSTLQPSTSVWPRLDGYRCHLQGRIVPVIWKVEWLVRTYARSNRGFGSTYPRGRYNSAYFSGQRHLDFRAGIFWIINCSVTHVTQTAASLDGCEITLPLSQFRLLPLEVLAVTYLFFLFFSLLPIHAWLFYSSCDTSRGDTSLQFSHRFYFTGLVRCILRKPRAWREYCTAKFQVFLREK